MEVANGYDNMEYEVRKYVRFWPGKKMSISPSQGFLGIEDGVVEIVHVLSYEGLTMQPYFSTLGDPETLVEDVPMYADEPWVVWKYRKYKENDDTLYAFPASLLAEHVSSY